MCESAHWTSMNRLRHSGAAQLARKWIYRSVVGGTAWPLKFKAPIQMPQEEPVQDLYVHIPFCRTLCPHCPYLKRRYQQSQAAEYSRALLTEVTHWLKRSPHLPIRSIYFGGGTPTLLMDGIVAMLNALGGRMTPETGIGLELHPADVTMDLVKDLLRLHFDRVSLGVESLRAETLRQLGRQVEPCEILRAVECLTEGGFACVDANLIYGIDGQTADEVLCDAKKLIDLGVDQISAYPLFSFRHTKVGVLADWRNFQQRDRIARSLRELCIENKLVPSSVWSFTRPTKPAYTTVTLETFRGFGAGAASRGIRSFRFHTFDIDEYMKPGGQRLAMELSADERFFKAHWLYWKIYQLRVPTDRYSELFGTELESDFRCLKTSLKTMGWMHEEAGAWQIRPRGADWIHRLQQLYSLSWIDLFWERCQTEAWPKEVVLL